jgi:1A family penicillin-binding protein
MSYIYSPKKNQEKYSGKKSKHKKFWKIIEIVFGAGIIFVAGVFLFFSKDLPSPGKVNDRFVAESTKIYDRTGTHVLYDIHGEEKRTVIPFSDMPDNIKFATIALEDQDFYNHKGIKLSSIIRAILADILHRGASQGGSTITQQFVKNSILTRDKTITRKIKEVILSVEMEQKFTKDEILGMYLNEIPYGSNAYGIQAAAQTFFSKNAKDLTLDEAALLASLPQAPSYYSPFGSHPEDLKARQEMALKKLYTLGYISEDQMNEAKSVDVLAKISPYKEAISAPHFVMYVKEYLENKYGKQEVEQDGLKVYTTLDWDKQQVAEQAVREGAEKNTKAYKATNASLVAIDPRTGQILAMVGSKDYFDKSIDGQVNVAIRDRQPGSSFKPYVYLTAFTKGYTPETQIWDVDTNFSTDSGKDYNPKNYDGKNRGLLQMKNTLAMSLNVPAVETLYLAGVQNSINMAKKLGIATLNNPQNYGLSLVLGGGEVELLDHVNAFATLANDGVKHEKTPILKIEDSKGEVLEEYKNNPGEKVVDEKYIAMLDYILSTNDLRAPVFGSNSPLAFSNRPVAAKTGTTNEWRDGWTMGYTPSIAVGVWAGNNNNSPMTQGADGVFTAAPIWRKFMDAALKNSNVEQFPKYDKEASRAGKAIIDGEVDPTQEMKVCEYKKNKYCLADSGCSDDNTDKKKVFSGHSILWYVDKNDPRGKIPQNPESDPQFANWEKAVQKWADKENLKVLDNGSGDKCKAIDISSLQPTGDTSTNDTGASNPGDASLFTEVNFETPYDGETILSSSFDIKVSAPDTTRRLSLSIDGTPVSEVKKKSSLSFFYSIPAEKNNSGINLKATAYDKKGKEIASSSITVYASF